MRLLKTFTIIIFTLLVLPVSIFADSFSLSIAPQFQGIISQRNKTITLPYTITNLGDPQVIQLKIYKLQVKDSSGSLDLVPYMQNDTSVSFEIPESSIQLSTPFLMKAKNTLSFNLAMTIPATANETDYYFSLVAESESQKGFGNTSSVLIQGGVGSHILLSVSDSGSLEQQGNIVQFDILSDHSMTINNQKIAFFDSNEVVPTMLIAANTGRNFARTSGSITLIPYFFKGKPQNDIHNQIKEPNESISYTIIPQYLLSGSQGALKTTTDPGCDKNDTEICKQPHSLAIKAPLIGIYRLSSVVSFGENAQIAFNNVTFVSFPFQIATFFILSCMIILILSHILQKKFKTRIK